MKHLISAALVLVANLCFAQANTWMPLHDFGGTARNNAASFAIGSKVYVGTGYDQSSSAVVKDLWMYDTSTDTWVQKNDFGSDARLGAVGFAISGKGYIGLGGDTGSGAFNDLWEYDPTTDLWTKKANFPGGARAGASVFIANNKAYIGMGEGPAGGYHDLWEYNPTTNVWTQKTSLPAASRLYAAAFAIGTKGYVGTGQLTDDDPTLKDFWEYDVTNDLWTRKADYPVENAGTVAFTDGSRGFVSGGSAVATYSYYPSKDVWMQEADYPLTAFAANGVCAIASNGSAYVGTGLNGSGSGLEFYSYTFGAEQTITFGALSAKTYGDAGFSLTGSSTSSLIVSYTSSNTGVATVTGSTVAILGAGTTVITASQAGNGTFDVAIPVKRTLTVNKANQTITFGALAAKNVNDAAFSLTGTISSGLTIAYTSSNTGVATIAGSTVTIVGAGTTSITASQSGDANRNAATPVSHDLVVNKLSQTITFGALPSKSVSDGSFTLTATATSGLDVTYTSSNADVATISGNMVTLVSGGTATITASQGGDATYAAATSVDQPLTVTKGSQSWVGSLPTTAGYADVLTLPLHLSSNLPYTLTSSDASIATVAKSGPYWVITAVGIGTTSLTASNDGNANYDAVSPLTADLVISKGTQTITFDDVNATYSFAQSRVILLATSSSGLPITYAADDTHFEIEINGNVITMFSDFTGTITAKVDGNDFYLPAQLTKNLVIAKGSMPVTLEPIPDKVVGDPPFTPVTNISPNNGEYSLLSTNTSVATINGVQVVIVGKGTTTIYAELADERFGPSAASQQLVVKDSQTINFQAITEKNAGDVPFQVTAVASSGLPVTFTSADPSIATVSGSTVTILSPGDVAIIATAGDNTYANASSSQILHVRNVDQAPQEQGQLWGVLPYGGDDKAGAIFKTNGDGTGFTIARSFHGDLNTGVNPTTNPVFASNGKLYGFTDFGGTNDAGILFEYDPATHAIAKKYDCAPAENVTRSWVATSDGKLYGATQRPFDTSIFGWGLVEFDITTGVFTKVTSTGDFFTDITDIFKSNDGKIYVSGRKSAQDRVFYEYDPATASLTKKAEMVSADGSVYAFITEGPGGKFYGTTRTDGVNGEGSIFEFDPAAGTANSIVDFDKAGFNTTTAQGVMLASNGKMYGTTQYGGVNSIGYLYEFDPTAGTITKLVDFTKYFGEPGGPMVEAPNGMLYGAGYPVQDGQYAFDFNTKTNELRIISMIPKNVGQFVRGNVLLSGDKIWMFGYEGGEGSAGAIIEFDYATRTPQTAASFGGGSSEGFYPMGGITPASNGKLYGITRSGGATNDGSLYEYDPVTDEFTTKFSFNTKTTGAHPQAKLIAGFDGKLYGGTREGGIFNMGSIFQYDPDANSMRILVDLINGDGPGLNLSGEIVQAASGKIYAQTWGGGQYNDGSLLEIDPSTREVKKLFALQDQDGKYSTNGLLIASNGKIYGATNEGGANNDGALFEYDIQSGTYALKHDFDIPTGYYPNGGLVEVDGKLYGTTLQGGGSFSTGILYEYDMTTGSYTVKYEFTVGVRPGGKLLKAANGKLYGTTSDGNGTVYSTLFEYDVATGTVVLVQDLPMGATLYYPNMSLSQTLKAFRHDQSVTIDDIDAKVLGGATFTPTATATSGLDVVLSAGNDKITVTNNVVTLIAAGKATIKANQGGDASYNAAQEIEATFCINPTKPTISSAGSNTSLLTLTSSGANGNQWYKDDVAIDNATSTTLQVTTPGVYTVKATVEECASELSNAFPVIVTGDIDANFSIALYPNPVQEKLYIALPGGNQKRITLIQMNGRTMEEHHTSASLLEVDVHNYSQGLYIVRIADENGERPAMKFIKK